MENLLVPISVVANELSIHQRTLRIYDEEGILKPSRSAKGRRLYSMDDLKRGKLIQYMTANLGINLAGVKLLLSISDRYSKGVPPTIEMFKQFAQEAGITLTKQAENKTKLSRRGRKKSAVTV